MKTIAHIFIIAFVIASFFVLKDDIADFWNRTKNTVNNYLAETDILSFSDSLAEQKRDIRLPGPLRELTNREASEAYLTVNGIISQTNARRAAAGLPALKANTLLNQSAELKVDDMFTKQYFEHVAPDGTGVGDLGDDIGYDYITIGENLAQGNFLDDAAVVSAWMNSEGHRANILHERYTEIGVSVAKGEYDGRTIWMAVQHFGLPRTECPAVNDTLRSKIENNQETLNTLEVQIQELRAKIDDSDKSDPEYNSYVEEHNKLVNEYNVLIQNTKTKVDQYNNQVRAYNSCAEA